MVIPSSAPPERVFTRSLLLALLLCAGAAIPVWPQQSSPPDPGHTPLPDAPQSQLSAPPPPAEQTGQPAPAQSADPTAAGSIQGIVVDRDGAVYEGVHITLTQKDQPASAEKIATSDNNGHFVFSNVLPGPFQLTASSTGFSTQSVSGLLRPGENYQAPPIVLPFASTTTEVQVTASRAEIATEELHAEEQQRVFGVIPNFYVVYAPNAPPLTAQQKFHLAWRSEIDPVSIAAGLAEAAVEQASNDYRGYGQGAQGYAKRFGAAYGTDFIGTMIGGALLPSLLKQDPRYFYKGAGTVRSRAFYAIANAVICKSDKGTWQPNYSGIVGSLAAGGIANLYYPAADRNGAALTFESAFIGIGTSAIENLFQEFLVRKLTPHVPNYGNPKP